MRRLLAVLLLLAHPAHAESIIGAVRAGQWAQAEALADADPDPLARKLVLFYRLLAPGAARAAEIAAFMVENPDWPQQALLSRRLQEALAVDKDDRTVLAICRQHPPQAVPSLLRCADVESHADLPDAATQARRAWQSGITDPAGEAAFLRRWGPAITADEQWRRFDRLAWTEPQAGGPATRQALRLDPARRAAAEARLALRRDAPTAPALARQVPDAARTDPGLVLELARWFRRAGQDVDAAGVWTGPGVAAEAAAPAERRGAFWDERNLLARRLLRSDQPALAYAVAGAPAADAAALDQAFLAGWIALRRLNRPAEALEQFSRLLALSPAAITQARAHYWMGRAWLAGGAAAAAATEFDAAARWPTTFYGQLAAHRGWPGGTDPAAGTADPGWDEARAIAFFAGDDARAAVLLAAWGDPRRGKAFLQRLDELATDPVQRAMAARLALGLGLPEQAVAIARRAGRDGVMLPDAGWPSPVVPPPGLGDPAVLLGLMRQESSFDVQANSPVGARGLMQLMPGTAAGVARKLGLPADVPALTADPAYNMRLGATYLQDLLGQFRDTLPLAIAGYNAGPGRVQDWLVAQPDPAATEDDMIDWIELIPFNETRNYVQRVIENIGMYRARHGTAGPDPLGVRRS